jgi:hypothetical protein
VTPSRTASVTPSNTVTPSITASITPSNTPTPSVTPSRTASITPSRTATPSLSPASSITPSPSCICAQPTISSVTDAGGGQISVAFSGVLCTCVASTIQYSTDNVNWGNSNSGGCTSPRVVTPPYSAPFYVRISRTSTCGATSAYSTSVYYNPTSATPTPSVTPSRTPSVTPSITPSVTPSITPSTSFIPPSTYDITFYGDQYTPAVGNGWNIVWSYDCVGWNYLSYAPDCPTNNGCQYAGTAYGVTANSTVYVAVIDCAFGVGSGISFDLAFNTQTCPDTNNFTYCEATDGSCSGSPYSFTITQNVDIAITVSVSKFGYGYCY